MPNVVRGAGEFDAASLAASADVNLRLDDDGQLHARGGFDRFVSARCHGALGHGNAVALQDLLGLILVDLQLMSPARN